MPGAPLIRGVRMSGSRESQPPVPPVTDGNDLSPILSGHDKRSGALVWRARPALHNLQLLSTPSGAWQRRAPRPVSAGLGARPAKVSLCRNRLRGNARTFPSSDNRAGAGKSFRGNESGQRAIHQAASPSTHSSEQPRMSGAPVLSRARSGKSVSTTSMCAVRQSASKSYATLHRNPVKRCLAEKPEEWKWSSFRTYACGEEGVVKVNCQEWPLRITYSASRTHSFETRE